MELIRPNKKHIERILRKYWKGYFYETDGALSLIFKSFPKNNNYHQVLAKVIILNQLYRTNIFDLFTVAQHIYSLRPLLDDELSKGLNSAVGKIAQVRFKSKTKYFYSFATKYCSWHYPEKYYIYDSYVESLLWEYNKKFNFFDYRRSNIRNYKTFHIVCTSFKRFFDLNWISNKILDEFLWLESKRFYGEL